ncbi:MAG: hydrogenase maturation nickel metallochaperone HypA/HybF [Bacillota bacterium]
MHELSLAQEVLSTINDSARDNGIRRVTRVRLVIGTMSGVLPEALRFSFDAVREVVPAWTPGLFAATRLDILEKEATAKCRRCGEAFPVGDLSDLPSPCPVCGSTDLSLDGGLELFIDLFEGD